MSTKDIQKLIMSMFNSKEFIVKTEIVNEILKNSDEDLYDEYDYTVTSLLKNFCDNKVLYKKGSGPNEKYYLYKKRKLKPIEVKEKQLDLFFNNKANKQTNIKKIEDSKESRDVLSKLYYIDYIKAKDTEVVYLEKYLLELNKEIDLFIKNFKTINNPEEKLNIREFLFYINISKIIIRKQEEVEYLMDKIKSDKDYIQNKELLVFSKDLIKEIDDFLLNIEEKLPNRRVEREFELNASKEEKDWYYELLDYIFRIEDLNKVLKKESDRNE